MYYALTLDTVTDIS